MTEHYHPRGHTVTETPETAMRPEDVPDELLMLGLSAAARETLTTDIRKLIDYDIDEHEGMGRALAAVLPAHKTMVRAEFADEVMAVLGGAPDHQMMLRLARLLGEAKDAARGEQP
jgi:hypothetical protein